VQISLDIENKIMSPVEDYIADAAIGWKNIKDACNLFLYGF